MTVLLYDIPSLTAHDARLVDLGIAANYETEESIGHLLDHLSSYIPDIHGVNTAEDGWLEQIGADRVLNYTYGFGLLRDSVRATLVLEGLRADYVGAEPHGLYWSANKPHLAALMKAIGFAVPAERLVASPLSRIEAETISANIASEWLVVKPAYEESSLGLALIPNEPEQLQQTVVRLHEALRDILVVQEYIDGLDVTVPVVGRRSFSCLPAVVLEHDADQVAPFVFGADQKATKASVRYRGVSQWPTETRHHIYDMAIRSCRLAGLRDYARLDCRVTDAGICYFLEVNANPQLGLEKASFAVSAAEVGMEIGQVVRHIVSYEELPYGATPLSLGH